MKKLIAVALVVAFAMLAGAFPAEAGIVRHAVKPAAKAASYPARHPKRTMRHVGSAVRRAIW